jgi:hypothetical protein
MVQKDNALRCIENWLEHVMEYTDLFESEITSQRLTQEHVFCSSRLVVQKGVKIIIRHLL